MPISAKPIGDRIIVKAELADEARPSGIIIPETAREKPNQGTIVAVGCGKISEPLTVKNGDKVLYSKNSGIDILIDGEPYLIMRESDLYAIL